MIYKTLALISISACAGASAPPAKTATVNAAVQAKPAGSIDSFGANLDSVGVLVLLHEVIRLAVTVDRPFLFFVRDDATGAVLFARRITDPSA